MADVDDPTRYDRGDKLIKVVLAIGTLLLLIFLVVLVTQGSWATALWLAVIAVVGPMGGYAAASGRLPFSRRPR